MALTSLARVKGWLGIPDTNSDVLLEEIIAGVEAEIQQHTRRTIIETTVTAEKVDGNGRTRLTLEHYPIASSPAVVVRLNGTVVDAGDYEVDTDVGQLVKVKDGAAGTWTAGCRNYEVDYTAGYDAASIPEPLILAATKQAAYTFTKRGSAISERGTILDFGGSAQFLTGRWAPGVREAIEEFADRRVI